MSSTSPSQSPPSPTYRSLRTLPHVEVLIRDLHGGHILDGYEEVDVSKPISPTKVASISTSTSTSASTSTSTSPSKASIIGLTVEIPPRSYDVKHEMTEHKESKEQNISTHPISSTHQPISTHPISARFLAENGIQLKPELMGKQASGMVGLLNQGATCYLNSLLQSLFMTPEFRAGIMSWSADEYVATRLDQCIPYQLQLLFGRLLLSNRGAVTTTDLTHSFHWTQAESFRQHDIQELMRVLFTALEKTFHHAHARRSSKQHTASSSPAIRSTSPSTSPWASISSTPSTSRPLSPLPSSIPMHQHLSQASSLPTSSPPASSPSMSPTLSPTTNSSFVNALYEGQLIDYIECCECHTRRERIDTFLDISLDISTSSTTLVNALHEYIKPERLEKENQFMCSICQHKCDAIKGLKLAKLPPILTIQLKRFVFDFTLLQRVKLQHEVSFERILDMSPFITSTHEHKEEYQYHLFAILMHSGTAMGGHYFAYIRSPTDSSRWYHFNDAHVTSLTDAEFRGAWGGQKGGASAYMLMYRHGDANMEEVQVPAHIQKIIAEEDAKYQKERESHERELRTLDLHIYHSSLEQPLHLRRDLSTPISTLTSHVADMMGIHDIHNMRLRRYVPEIAWMGTCWEGEMTLEEAGMGKKNSLMVETKGEGEAWIPFNPNDIPLRIRLITPTNITQIVTNAPYPCLTSDTLSLAFDRTATLSSLCQHLTSLLGVQPQHQRIVRMNETKCDIMNDHNMTLAQYGITPGAWLYVEDIQNDTTILPTASMPTSTSTSSDILTSSSDITATSTSTSTSPSKITSPLIHLFDQHQCQITIQFNRPVSGNDIPVYDQHVRLSRNDTMKMLKQRISAIIDIPVDEFRLSRSAKAAQFKDEDVTLAELQLVDCSGVYVAAGRPLRKDEYAIRYFLYDRTRDKTKCFEYLFELPMSGNIKMRDMKHMLMDYLYKKNPGHGTSNGFGIEHMRLRDKKGNSSTKIYCDERTLKENIFNVDDGQEICIQKIDAEEIISKDHLLVMVREWMVKQQKLGAVTDVVVRKMCTIGTFRSQLHQFLGIPPEWIALARGKLATKMTKIECQRLQFLDTEQLPDTRLMKGPPLSMTGGDLFIYKDLRKEEKNEEKQQEKKTATKQAAKPWLKSTRSRVKHTSTDGVNTPSAAYRPIEHSLRIDTLEDINEAIAKMEREFAEKQAHGKDQPQEAQQTTSTSTSTSTSHNHQVSVSDTLTPIPETPTPTSASASTPSISTSTSTSTSS